MESLYQSQFSAIIERYQMIRWQDTEQTKWLSENARIMPYRLELAAGWIMHKLQTWQAKYKLNRNFRI